MKTISVAIGLFLNLIFSNCYALSASEVVDKVGNSVVYVMTYDDKKNVKASKRMYGSGVAVKKKVIATNCHVARSGHHILVIKNRRTSAADIIGSNDRSDICLLYVHDLSFAPVTLRKMDQLKVGEDVYSIGNPGAIENYVSRGIISKLLRWGQTQKIYSDVTTAQGSSGGGLFDTEGNLIGITTAVSKKNKNISVSVPVDWIIENLKIRHVAGSDQTKNTIINKVPKQPGIRLIGKYGADHVALYQLKNRCFIYLSGRTSSGLKTSAALWFPGDRKSLYFFPFSKEMLSVLRVIKAQKKVFATKDKKMTPTAHKVVFEGKTIPVQMFGDARLSNPVLYARFEKNPTLRLAEGDDLTLYLCGAGRCSSRTFGLYGFSDALIHYNSACVLKR